jgi:hypothetical protein
MSISIFDKSLKRLASLAEKRKLDWLPISESVFIVDSSRAGIPPYRLTLEGETIHCPCKAGRQDLACTHASVIVKHRFPVTIALNIWHVEDARETAEIRLAIEKGEVSPQRLAYYRRVYRQSKVCSEMERKAA